MRLSIGPISYFWQRDDVLAFYEEAGEGPAEIVYLGEIVCSKRRLVKPEDWLAIGRDLSAAGKQVVLSSLTLLEAASEMGALKKLCGNGEFMVEANDIAAVQLLSDAGTPFVVGPAVNIYNHRSMCLLAGKGMRRWVLPVELGLNDLRDLQAARPADLETEVFAFGRLPLAWSARCYTARSYNLPKDDCRFKCLEYPDGRLLKTRENEDFLVLNGIQTQSALTHQALLQVDALEALDVDILRLSPQSRHWPEIVSIFDRARHGADAQELAEELCGLLPTGPCNGFLLARPGLDHADSHLA
ncbi:MAG: U32 family peptidase [Lysobacterales bacterium]|jgi:collagenase-like PrtC family protease